MQTTNVLAIIAEETEPGKGVPIGDMFLSCRDPAKFESQTEMITQAWKIGLEACGTGSCGP